MMHDKDLEEGAEAEVAVVVVASVEDLLAQHRCPGRPPNNRCNHFMCNIKTCARKGEHVMVNGVTLTVTAGWFNECDCPDKDDDDHYHPDRAFAPLVSFKRQMGTYFSATNFRVDTATGNMSWTCRPAIAYARCVANARTRLEAKAAKRNAKARHEEAAAAIIEHGAEAAAPSTRAAATATWEADVAMDAAGAGEGRVALHKTRRDDVRGTGGEASSDAPAAKQRSRRTQYITAAASLDAADRTTHIKNKVLTTTAALDLNRARHSAVHSVAATSTSTLSPFNKMSSDLASVVGNKPAAGVAGGPSSAAAAAPAAPVPSRAGVGFAWPSTGVQAPTRSAPAHAHRSPAQLMAGAQVPVSVPAAANVPVALPVAPLAPLLVAPPAMPPATPPAAPPAAPPDTATLDEFDVDSLQLLSFLDISTFYPDDNK